MPLPPRPLPHSLLLAGLVLAAPNAGRAAGQAAGMPMAAPVKADSPADREMMAGMAHMSQSMKQTPMTGDPDHDFVAMMIPHHKGAIDMAEIELRYGKDPEMRRLAREIVAAQKREITQMTSWTAAHHAD